MKKNISIVSLMLVTLFGGLFFLTVSNNKMITENARNILTTGTFNLDKKAAQKESIIPTAIKAISGPSFLPSVKFSRWEGFGKLTKRESAPVYTLKTYYTEKEAEDFIANFDKNSEVKRYKNTYLAYNTDKSNKNGSVLILDAKTGQFFYRSVKGLALDGDSENINEQIYSFLKRIGIYDSTIKISATYKRHSSKNIFVEIKRDWSLAGLQILNPLGLLNIPETKKISDLTFKPEKDSSLPDNDIYETSDNSDGQSRKNDFNSATIEWSEKDNKIVSVVSTLRKVKAVNQKEGIISDTDAVKKLLAAENASIFTSPSGDGIGTPWEKIYPNRMAQSKLAHVYDTALAYLEHMPGIDQNRLEPFYIFRGKATLTSGYDTDFIAVVPATESDTTGENHNFFSVIPAPVYAQYDPTQKQATFILTEATPDPNPPTPTPNFSETCIPKVEDLNPRSTIQSTNGSDVLTVGRSHIGVILNKVQLSRRGWWYFTPAPNSDQSTLQSDYTKALVLIRSVTNQTDFRRFNDTRYNPPGVMGVWPDYQKFGSACPIRITGESPTIFIYADPGAEIGVEPYSRITYSDPSLDDDGRWNVKVNEGGNLWVNSSYSRDYLYYEYNPSIKFQRPNKGWNINKEDIEEFVKNNISLSLKLNEKETERTIFEIRHAAENIDNNNIFIGIINKKEIDDKLPLKVTGKDMKIIRIHFYVGEVGKEDMNEPEVDAIKRDKNMLIEIGGWSD